MFRSKRARALRPDTRPHDELTNIPDLVACYIVTYNHGRMWIFPPPPRNRTTGADATITSCSS